MHLTRKLGRRGYSVLGCDGDDGEVLTLVAKPKDLYPQYGATSNVFRQGVELGMVAVISNMNLPKMRVFWDRFIKALEKQAAMTFAFKDITGIVDTIDGRKLMSLQPVEWLEQNQDYNG